MNKIKVVILIIILILSFCICSYIEHNYTREGVITRIDNNIIQIEDTAENTWIYETTDNYKIGDKVTLKMYDKCTPTIKDDEIKSIKKSR